MGRLIEKIVEYAKTSPSDESGCTVFCVGHTPVE